MLSASPPSEEVKLIPARLADGTGVPLPFGKPAVVLYSIPYAVSVPHPAEETVPATVADVEPIGPAAPEAVAGGVLIPVPETEVPAEVPPPFTGMVPEYEMESNGLNFTNIVVLLSVGAVYGTDSVLT